MPKKNPSSLFHRLARLRARVRRIKSEVCRIKALAGDKDVKLQLSQARDLLLEAEDMMTPMPEHVDQQLRVAAVLPVAAAA